MRVVRPGCKRVGSGMVVMRVVRPGCKRVGSGVVVRVVKPRWLV